MRQRIIFITGTDTGVGKTVVTGLLLSHFRQIGCRALALKPFCSGGRGDAELLHALQEGELTLDKINPFHFSEPLAPMVAARLHHRKISFDTVLEHIRAVATRSTSPQVKVQRSKFKGQSSLRSHSRIPPFRPVHRSTNPSIHQSINPVLLIEGAGGLLSPLGESPFKGQRSKFKVQSSVYSALDLIKALDCKVVLVAANRLGTINHTLLTLDKLRQADIHDLVLVLNELLPKRNAGLDSRYNGALLCEIAKPAQIVGLPYLGKCSTARDIKERAIKIRTSLRKISKLAHV